MSMGQGGPSEMFVWGKGIISPSRYVNLFINELLYTYLILFIDMDTFITYYVQFVFKNLNHKRSLHT